MLLKLSRVQDTGIKAHTINKKWYHREPSPVVQFNFFNHLNWTTAYWTATVHLSNRLRTSGRNSTRYEGDASTSSNEADLARVGRLRVVSFVVDDVVLVVPCRACCCWCCGCGCWSWSWSLSLTSSNAAVCAPRLWQLRAETASLSVIQRRNVQCTLLCVSFLRLRFLFVRRIFTPFRRRRLSDILSVVVFWTWVRKVKRLWWLIWIRRRRLEW